MSKIVERQRLIRAYRDETGETEIDMRKVAEFAVKKGWPLPKPTDPLDALAKLFSDAARLETRIDPETGNSYRKRVIHTAQIMRFPTAPHPDN